MSRWVDGRPSGVSFHPARSGTRLGATVSDSTLLRTMPLRLASQPLLTKGPVARFGTNSATNPLVNRFPELVAHDPTAPVPSYQRS